MSTFASQLRDLPGLGLGGGQSMQKTAGLTGVIGIIIYVVLFILTVMAWSRAKRAAQSIDNATWTDPNAQAMALDDANKAKDYAGAVWITQVVLFLLGLLGILLGAMYAKNALYGSSRRGRYSRFENEDDD